MQISALDDNETRFVRERLDFIDRLTASEVKILEGAISRVRYAKGTVLHSKDSECLGVLLVHTGELRAYIVSEDGREVTLYRLKSGDVCVLSASCVLNSLSFDVLIDTDRDSEVFKINLVAFQKLMKDNVYVENFAYKNAAERFSDVMWAVEQILFMRFDKRLAIFLLDESASTGEVSMTHEEIARHIGSAREVVSRMLKTFEAQGIVSQSRGIVRIANRDLLKKILNNPSES